MYLLPSDRKVLIKSYPLLKLSTEKEIVDALLHLNTNQKTTLYFWMPEKSINFFNIIVSGTKLNYGHVSLKLPAVYKASSDNLPFPVVYKISSDDLSILPKWHFVGYADEPDPSNESTKSLMYPGDYPDELIRSNYRIKRYFSFTPQKSYSNLSQEEEVRKKHLISLEIPFLNSVLFDEVLPFLIQDKPYDDPLFSTKRFILYSEFTRNLIDLAYDLKNRGKRNNNIYRITSQNCSTVAVRLIQHGLGLFLDDLEDSVGLQLHQLWRQGRHEYALTSALERDPLVLGGFFSIGDSDSVSSGLLLPKFDITYWDENGHYKGYDRKDRRKNYEDYEMDPIILYLIARITEFCLTQSSVRDEMKSFMQKVYKERLLRLLRN